MAIGTTLPIDDLCSRFRVLDTQFQLARFEETSGTGRGEIITRQFAPPKWQAVVTFAPILASLSGELQARIELMEEGVRFFLYNTRRPYPARDPGGRILGNAFPTIQDFKADNKTMRLTGLPADYPLSVGDMLAFNLGDGRRALHRIVEPALASGTGGLTTYFEVRPHLRAGTAVDTPVALKRPTAKMQILSGSFNPGDLRSARVSGMSFSAIEVY